jgi:epoxyqueuosine reductase
MGYLSSPRAIEGRANLKELLPECKSVLVLTTNYLPDRAALHPIENDVGIAAYAQGTDYHRVLLQRMRKLMADLQTWIGREIPYRAYTDTGPILEREFAMRAGLGWIGKNSCLIHPKLGSYFFLGEILLGLELKYDRPITVDYCGSCTRCIEACPTNCILPDRTLDARRCISYLTIELRAGIPLSLREKIGTWFFGCDICQQVCPWNLRFAKPTPDVAFQIRPELQRFDPLEIISMDDREYQELTRGSPLKRAKQSGLRRNAMIVAGNLRHETAVSALLGTLNEDPDPMLRAHAAWALRRILGEMALPTLKNALESEVDPGVRIEIEHGIKNSNFD